VQSLAHQWGYVRDEGGTIVWFWLDAAVSYTSATPARAPLAAS